MGCENEMRPEYDFTGAVRGKYAEAFRRGHKVIIHMADGTTEERTYSGEGIEMPDNDQTRRDLTLMLMYLNSWIERDPAFEVRRFWKGYDFGDIDDLEEQGFINQSKRAKSAYFTGEGVAKVRELLAKYGVADPESETET